MFQILAEYEWKKNLFQAFLLFTENERMEEINFMEHQVYEVEAALEEHFACKLKVMRDGLTSILYVRDPFGLKFLIFQSNAAMVDEVSRISGKLLVTGEERKWETIQRLSQTVNSGYSLADCVTTRETTLDDCRQRAKDD